MRNILKLRNPFVKKKIEIDSREDYRQIKAST